MSDLTQQTAPEAIEAMAVWLKDEQAAAAANIPERCRGCWESNPSDASPQVLDAYITAANRRLERGEPADDVVIEADKACWKSVSATLFASLGLCVSGLVEGDTIENGEVDGEPLKLVVMKCGLDSRVKLDTPGYDMLCKRYAALSRKYRETTDDAESSEIDRQLRALEQQFPIDYDELMQLVGRGKVYFKGLELLRAAQEQ